MRSLEQPLAPGTWTRTNRPGYFGRRRDEKIAELNRKHGDGHWALCWYHPPVSGAPNFPIFTFASACVNFYERSYFEYLQYRPDDIDFICEFRECYDNAETNIDSGLDYTKQEAFSTHIQDIAVRNVLRRLDVWFTGANGRLLQIRSRDSEGYRFGPGAVPFYAPALIEQPSLAPHWASKGSVEDFWQSNKFVWVRE